MMIRDPNYDSPLIPQVDPQKKENDLEVFSIRWFMLIMFVFSGVANALVLLSFSPISNLGILLSFCFLTRSTNANCSFECQQMITGVASV